MSDRDTRDLSAAIRHARDVAAREAGTDCGADHARLAEWLDELRGIRAQPEPTTAELIEALSSRPGVSVARWPVELTKTGRRRGWLVRVDDEPASEADEVSE